MKVNLINSNGDVLATDVNRLHEALVCILTINYATNYTVFAALKEMSVDGKYLVNEAENKAIVTIQDDWFRELSSYEYKKLSDKIDKLLQ